MNSANIHANCVVIGTKGVLIRGNSGTGKTVLSERLILAAHARGQFAALVADDRVLLHQEDGRLFAAPPETLKGQMEVRGFGVVNTDTIPSARVHFVVDLVEQLELDRMPETPVTAVTLEGVELPAIGCPAEALQSAIRLMRWAFRHCFPQSPDYF